ncbi:ImmA/IrrE family metallo-endopeptidase [Donghicola sp. C2-DW-16]|uniref:ImmA/IrrE family metallo-endopeptidase n=2 Tax=Donghicola mangrovi TaxID=2729614 RepID=A0ABX2PA12_9RHOB|nr:ImmA/IrrE family metallo-endopeptidase [Donghicola mangrovi]
MPNGPTKMSEANVYERIRPLLMKAPVPLEQIARSLGLAVEMSANLEQGISGEIACENGRYKISTASSEHLYRQRFTLAHELGHFALHRSLIGNGLDDNKMYRSDAHIGKYANSEIKLVHERQANAFAAKILMPRELLEAEIAKEKSTPGISKAPLTKLYRTFQVSPSAMQWRLKNLGLSDQVDMNS